MKSAAEVAAHYTVRAMEGPSSSYQALIAYRDELEPCPRHPPAHGGRVPPRRPGRVHGPATPVMSDVRWEGYSHDEIYARVQQGPGRLASADAEAAWSTVESTIRAVDAQLTRAVKRIGAGWQGRAADAVHGGMTVMSNWALDAAGDATLTRNGITAQAEQATRLRTAMPPPRTAEWDRMVHEQVPAVGLMSATGDLGALEERMANDRAVAVDLMNRYSSQSSDNQRMMNYWTQPPTVVVEAVAPASSPSRARVGDTLGAGAVAAAVAAQSRCRSSRPRGRHGRGRRAGQRGRRRGGGRTRTRRRRGRRNPGGPRRHTGCGRQLRSDSRTVRSGAEPRPRNPGYRSLSRHRRVRDGTRRARCREPPAGRCICPTARRNPGRPRVPVHGVPRRRPADRPRPAGAGRHHHRLAHRPAHRARRTARPTPAPRRSRRRARTQARRGVRRRRAGGCGPHGERSRDPPDERGRAPRGPGASASRLSPRRHGRLRGRPLVPPARDRRRRAGLPCVSGRRRPGTDPPPTSSRRWSSTSSGAAWVSARRRSCCSCRRPAARTGSDGVSRPRCGRHCAIGASRPGSDLAQLLGLLAAPSPRVEVRAWGTSTRRAVIAADWR